MFKIELVDIDGNGLIVDFNTDVDTLAEAEVIAMGEITKHLGANDIYLYHNVDLIYSVIRDEAEIGVVSIRSV